MGVYIGNNLINYTTPHLAVPIKEFRFFSQNTRVCFNQS